jgi:hypothetical protein
MYYSTLKRFRENRAEIEKYGDWISQADLSDVTGVDVRTIRALRREGQVFAETVRQNDVWIQTESIRNYCERSK